MSDNQSNYTKNYYLAPNKTSNNWSNSWTTNHTITHTSSTTFGDEWTDSKDLVTREININEEEYEILDIEDFLDEVKGLNDDRMKRIKNITVTCANCEEPYYFKTILRRRTFSCPECNNILFGMDKDLEYIIIKEILIGDDTNDKEE